MARILIVDDEEDLRWALSQVLESKGHEVLTARNGNDALSLGKKYAPDVALVDLRMPETDGMKVAEDLIRRENPPAVVMMTAYGDTRSAVQAIKTGAFDYLTKPLDNDELLLVIANALKSRPRSVQTGGFPPEDLTAIMGTGKKIGLAIEQIRMVAPTNMTVLIQGESGVGKEVAATAIHSKSKRKACPFVAIDCGSLPDTLVESELFGYEKGAFTGADNSKPGQFEIATGGTIFLDEIGNLKPSTQAKLLRVLEERKVSRLGSTKPRKVDVRVITATNVVLEDAVRKGVFREDLFHRVNEFVIKLPPLRERKEDILFLANIFLKESNDELQKNISEISPQAAALLVEYKWPGNVRELKNAVKRAVLIADKVIEPGHLSFMAHQEIMTHSASPSEESFSLKEARKRMCEEAEKGLIQKALAKTAGNKSKAAKLLGIDRSALHYKMKQYVI